jgi:hypothetical protein
MIDLQSRGKMIRVARFRQVFVGYGKKRRFLSARCQVAMV